MNNKARLIISFFIWGIGFEFLIIFLFPYSELAGMINFPVAIIISSVAVFIAYQMIFRLKVKRIYTTIFILILLQSLCQLYLLPQSRGSCFNQLKNYYDAFKNYRSVSYNNYSRNNFGERITFIHKFKGILPERFIYIEINNTNSNSYSPRIYRIEERKGALKYDTLMLKIIPTDSCLFLMEKLDDIALPTQYQVPKDLIEDSFGFSNDEVSINTYDDNFKIDNGIETVFYNLLGMSH